MEEIYIKSGDKVISKVFVEDCIEALEDCIEDYPHVFAVMDADVAMKCPAASQIAEVMNRRGVPGKLIEASEETKTMETVMEICGWLLVDRQGQDSRCGCAYSSDRTCGCFWHILPMFTFFRFMGSSFPRIVFGHSCCCDSGTGRRIQKGFGDIDDDCRTGVDLGVSVPAHI